MQFINPALAFGALLFAVPLIIHLLNRQRFRKRQWAAMEYLLKAFKKQRRRLRTENLILLLLRCLIPIVLAMAIARPFFASDGAILGAGGTTHHVMVFDRSYSMGYTPSGSASPHAKAMRLANSHLEQLSDQGADQVTLVLAGIRTEIPIKASVNLSSVRARLAQVGPPTDSAQSLLPALDQVADMLEEAAEKPAENMAQQVQVYVFTDLQDRCFGDEFRKQAEGGAQAPETTEEALKDNARDLLERIGKHANLTVMDMAGQRGAGEDNLQVTDLRLERSRAVAGMPMRATVTVRNRSQAGKTLAVSCAVDGAAASREMIEVAAGAEADVDFNLAFPETGMRTIKASIDTDGLEADNVCYRVVDVQERLRILMVEGSDADHWRLQDTGWLRKVIDPTEGEGDIQVAEFQTRQIDSITFLLGQEDLSRYHAIVLGDVERLTENIARQLKSAIEAGTGLLVMFGGRAQLDNYNLHLFDNGLGPMPIRLRSRMGFDPGGERYLRSEVADLEHPIFTDFKAAEDFLQLLQLAPVYRYVGAEVPDPEPEKPGEDPPAEARETNRAHVLWQVKDAELNPLMVAGRYGEGRTLFLQSGINTRPRKWNGLDATVLALPLFHSMAHWLSHPVTDPFNVTVGSGLSSIVRQRPSDMAVVLPERAGRSKVPVAQEARAMRGGLFSLPTFTRTEYAGIYQFEYSQAGGGLDRIQQLPFAVNPEPKEGMLKYFAHNELKERLGLQNVYTVLPEQVADAPSRGGSEWGLWLLYAVLTLILGEAAFARFISGRRH